MFVMIGILRTLWKIGMFWLPIIAWSRKLCSPEPPAGVFVKKRSGD
jgi:hypothetical protein